MNGSRRPPSFSLIELLLVMAVVAMLASMATTRFSGAMVRYRADAAADRIVADLSLVRRWAMLASTSQSIVFDVAGDTYVLSGGPHPDHPGQKYEVALSDEPYRANIISADFGGDTDATFDGYGVPDSGGTVVVEVGGLQRTIVLDADTGRAEVL